MSNIIGIDLGTTTSGTSFQGEMITEMLASVANPDTGEVGNSIKHDHSPAILRNYKTAISSGPEGKASRIASSMVLRELKRLTEEKGYTSSDCVITVPAQFGDDQRAATKAAAEEVGWNVLKIVNEPTAAALAYTQGRPVQIIVFDLGGGTFDVSIVDARFGAYDVLASKGNFKLGGKDFDQAIFRYVYAHAGFIMGQLTMEDVIGLRDACEVAKLTIQQTGEDYVFDLSSLPTTGASTFTLTVDLYLKLMKATFAEAVDLTKILRDRHLIAGDEATLLFVGGSTCDPFLREWVAEELGMEVAPITYNQVSIVAEGASILGEMVSKGEADTLVFDVTKAISVGINDGRCQTLIADQSKLPAMSTHTYVNDCDCDRVQIPIFAGDRGFQCDNEELGKLIYEFGETREAFDATIIVTIRVDLDGLIHVTAAEPGRGERTLTITRDVVESKVPEDARLELPFAYGSGTRVSELSIGEFNKGCLDGSIASDPLTEDEIIEYARQFEVRHSYRDLDGNIIVTTVGQYNHDVSMGRINGDYVSIETLRG